MIGNRTSTAGTRADHVLADGTPGPGERSGAWWSRFGRVAREVVLWVAAALGALCLLVAVVFFANDWTPVIFRTGSMSPSMPTGTLAVVERRPAEAIEIGDVVSVSGANGVRVTHRVVALAPVGHGRVALTLQGDANDEPDSDPFAVASADVVIWHQPGLGYVVETLESRPVVFAVGVFVGGWLVWFGRPGRPVRRDEREVAPGRLPASHAASDRAESLGGSP